MSAFDSEPPLKAICTLLAFVVLVGIIAVGCGLGIPSLL